MATKSQRGFSSGELSPELHFRADVAKYYTGLAVGENYFCLVRGGVANRPGWQFIAEVKDHTKTYRLIDFAYNSQQTYALVCGDEDMRVIKDAGQVVLSSTPSAWVTATAYAQGDYSESTDNYYCHTGHTSSATDEPGVGVNWADYWHLLEDDIVEIPIPFTETESFAVDYTQLGDVVTMVHRSHAPQELIRYDHDDWRISDKSFDVAIDPPSGTPTVTASPGSASTTTPYNYIVRAVDGSGDSVDSSIVSCLNQNKTNMLGSSAIYNSVSWTTVSGATSYDVYVEDAGTYYFLGNTSSTSYVDQDAVHSGVAKVAATGGGTPTAPTGVGVVATSDNERNYQYKITATSSSGEESVASTAGTAFNRDPFQEGDYNSITWNTVSGAVEYNVYKEYNGLFGYIGTNTAASFKDDNIEPDLSTTPPAARNPFDGAGDYPGAVEYFEQRMLFARTTNEPRTIWGTRSSLHNNMTVSTPAQDDNAITLTVSSRLANEFYYLVPLASLLAMADRGSLSLRGQDGYLTPKTPPQINKQGTEGIGQIPPLEVGDSILAIESSGKQVFDMKYDITVDGISSGAQMADRSVLSAHLFETYGIVDWCYARHPHNIVWAVREDGVLLSLTYHREHDVFGWMRHVTDGEHESICSIREDSDDAVYSIIKRNINGSDVRYIERLHTRVFAALEDAFFVDSGLTYDGAAATTISNLDHLESETVAVLADGNYIGTKVVTGGEITLDTAASKVHVGLPYTATIETLNIDSNESGIKGKIITVHQATISLLRSKGGYVGPTDDDDLLVPIEHNDDLYTGDFTVQLEDGGFDEGSNGRVVVKQPAPLPMTILAVSPSFTYSNIE